MERLRCPACGSTNLSHSPGAVMCADCLYLFDDCVGRETDVVSAALVDGRIEIVRREKSHIHPTMTGVEYPDLVWKEIYEAADGVIRLTRTVSGRHIPAHTTPERVEF